MKVIGRNIIVVLGFIFSTFSFADDSAKLVGDLAAGKAKAAVCKACHGGGGQAELPGYPKLAGQNEQYLISSMNAYKNGERTGTLAAVMKLQAQVLNQQDIANLAAYYSQLK